MKIETEDLTEKITPAQESSLVREITQKYDKYNDLRISQLDDARIMRETIYNTDIPKINGWDNKVVLPDIYELAQTLKSHISENLYSHPEAMFDVSGATPESQSLANKQKSMLVNTFEQMKLEDEIEKAIDSIVETGECTLFVGWMECFKFALEQYGIENADNFLKNEQTNVYQTSLLNMNT